MAELYSYPMHTDILSDEVPEAVPADVMGGWQSMAPAVQQAQAAPSVIGVLGGGSTAAPAPQQAPVKQDELSSKGAGTWPTVLAVLSALNGNFGPAIQLEEQKRKTELYKQMYPHLRTINSLAAKGEYEKAGDLADQLITRVGDRAPEMVKYMEGERGRIAQKHENYNAFKTATNFLDSTWKEDDIRRPIVDSMKKMLKTPSNVTEKVLGLMIGKANDPHIQWINGALRITDPTTLNTSEAPGKQFFEPPKGVSASLIQQQTGLTPENLTNAMNGRTFELFGQQMQSTPEFRAHLSQQLSKLAGTQAQMDFAQLNTMDPTQAEQRRNLGLSNEQIALRQEPVGTSGRVLQGLQERAEQLATAPIKAGIELDPTKLGGIGLTHFDTSPENFGQDTPALTVAEQRASGGRYVPIDKKIMYERVQPSIRALNDLKQSDRMFELLGLEDYASPLDRIQTGIRRKITQYTGLALKEGDTGATAIQALMNRAIEQLAESKAVPESSIGQLKKMATGIAGAPETAREMLQVFQDKVQRDIAQYVDKSKVEHQYGAPVQGTPQARLDNAQHEQMWRPMAASLGVEPALVQALLKNEGSGDQAVSRAGAIGRFQIMPETAAPYLAALSRRDGRPYTEADLKNPTTNAEVAMLHLATLKSKHSTWTVPHILAAYIGGEGAVNSDGSINTERREQLTAGGRPGNTVGNYVKTGMEHYNKAKPTVNFSFGNQGR